MKAVYFILPGLRLLLIFSFISRLEIRFPVMPALMDTEVLSRAEYSRSMVIFPSWIKLSISFPHTVSNGHIGTVPIFSN